MAKTIAIRLDDKGRVMIPAKIRNELGVTSGDTLMVRTVGKVLQITKAHNPFETLAHHAIRERKAGRTKKLRQVAQEIGATVANE